MKIAARTHPKLYDLCDRLKCGRPAAIGYLELLWAGTSEHAPAGDIGKFTDGAIARWCDWTGDPSEFVNALIESRWLSEDAKHRLVVHDWAEHCPNWLKTKMRRMRLDFVNSTGGAYERSNEHSTERSNEPTNEPSVEQTNERSVEGSVERSTSLATSRLAKPAATPTLGTYAESNGWTAAAAAASAFGVTKARVIADRCRESGVPLTEFDACLEHWREHSGEFDGAGALVTKLTGLFPGQPLLDGWPKRTRQPPPAGADIHAECRDVRALGDEEIESLAQQAFAGKAGLMANWKDQGRKSETCIEHIARFRIRSRSNGRQ